MLTANNTQYEETPARRGRLFWLRVSIAIVFVAFLVLGGLLARELLFKPQEPRTMAELKIMNAQDLVRKNRYDPRTHILLASMYLEAGKDSEAAEEFKSAISLAPDNWFAHFGLGNVYVLMKKEKKAEGEFKIAMILAPEEGQIGYALGNLYMEQKKWSDAVTILEYALTVDPDAADTHYLLGRAYEATGKKDEALAQYNEALRFVPDLTEASRAIERLTKKEAATP